MKKELLAVYLTPEGEVGFAIRFLGVIVEEKGIDCFYGKRVSFSNNIDPIDVKVELKEGEKDYPYIRKVFVFGKSLEEQGFERCEFTTEIGRAIDEYIAEE